MKQLTLLIFVSISLLACNGTNIKNRVSTLDETILQYNIGLRWAMYKKIESYHMQRDGSRKGMDRNALKNIRVTGYEVLEKNILDEEMSEVSVTVLISYYSTDRGTVKKLPYTANWWYEPEAKRWLNESEYPELK